MLVSNNAINTDQVSNFFSLKVKEEAYKMLRLQFKNNSAHVNPELYAKDVLSLVCSVLDLDYDKVIEKNRSRHLSEARQIYFYLIFKLSSIKITSSVAGMVLERDHATALYGSKNCEILMGVDPVFREKLNRCVAAHKMAFGNNDFSFEYNFIPQF